LQEHRTEKFLFFKPPPQRFQAFTFCLAAYEAFSTATSLAMDTFSKLPWATFWAAAFFGAPNLSLGFFLLNSPSLSSLLGGV
jgi:hypothetical protein